jgi:extracellular factor (EF) 3-hydroxypalmitic acid methyl ester biosynthesis protein
MSSPSEKNFENPGASHADLVGGSPSLRFRAQRLSTEDLSGELSCRFSVEENFIGPLPVLDISPTGMAVEQLADTLLTPGGKIAALEITYGGKVLWKGRAQVIYSVGGSPARAGLRFTSRLFDLQLLRLDDSVIGTKMQALLEQQSGFEKLPTEWRAGVTHVRHLLLNAQELLQEAEPRLSDEPGLRANQERSLFERIFESWGTAFHQQVSSLHEQSKAFQSNTLKSARAFAARELLLLTFPCPIHSRAYEKPLGYAGDYIIMLLLMTDQLEGEGLYGRFLHYVTQRYTLGRAVRSRERNMRLEIMKQIDKAQPSKIAALACGPALEIQRFLQQGQPVNAPVEFLLIDQDESTMQYCHESLSRLLMDRDSLDSGMISLNGLHLSVMQILRPQEASDKAFIDENLSQLDLIYSAGLYDYLRDSIARRLTRRLYSMLRPGGKLFIGNLVESPDSSWMMEYVSSWFLEYRTEESMLNLTGLLSPRPASVSIVKDETEHCLFLEVVRPVS